MSRETSIGVLNERPLHASLKEWYRGPRDEAEVPVDGFVVDLVRGDVLIEVQTKGFASMRRKLDTLLDLHPIRLVYPIAAEKWIIKLDTDGAPISRRKSPKRGIPADVCAELVSFPSLLDHPHFMLEVLMIQEEEVRRHDPDRWRRGGWVLHERRLMDVNERHEFASPPDLLHVLPKGLPDRFTTADIARGLGRSRHLAQEVAYCLRESEAIVAVGRTRQGIVYSRG